jgi:hypothetical protein
MLYKNAKSMILLAVLAGLMVLALSAPAEGEYTAGTLKARKNTLITWKTGDRSGSDLLTLPELFPSLYSRFKTPYQDIRRTDVKNIHRRFRLRGEASEKEQLYFLLFLHDLMTATGIRDGKTGGLLDIPYYRHWTIPNPRHTLVRNHDSQPLVLIDPPITHSGYDTFADLDRTPDIFLGDLLRDGALYRSPDGKTFSTFGWCSEREMAFTALLTLYGYDARIVQRGSHTWSEVRLTLTVRNGKPVTLIAVIDNTWDRVRFRRDTEPELPVDTWLDKDIGAGTFIVWYNDRAHDPLMLATLEQMAATPDVVAEMEGRIAGHLKR